MPTYDYRCTANGQVVEVWHGMNEVVTTWGQLCDLVGIDKGETPLESPVERLITGGQVVKSGNLGSAPPCSSGSCCGAGGCGFE